MGGEGGGAAAAGGGGGGTRVALLVFLVWLGIGMLVIGVFAFALTAGVGRDTGAGAGVNEAAEELADTAAGGGGTALEPAFGRGLAARLPLSRDGRPFGPPGLISLPRVIGRGGTGLPLGVGRDTELGESPG